MKCVNMSPYLYIIIVGTDILINNIFLSFFIILKLFEKFQIKLNIPIQKIIFRLLL